MSSYVLWRRVCVATVALCAMTFGLSAPAFANAGTGTLAGRITDQAGAPVVGAVVDVYGAELDGPFWTDSDGSFRMEVPVGTYQVSFTAPYSTFRQYFFGARYLADAADITVSEGQETFVEDQMLPTGAVRLTATDAATGAAIDDFCANVDELSECSGGSGELVLSGLPGGDHSLWVTGDGYLGRFVDVTVTPGQTTPASAVLDPESAIVTTVRDAGTGQPVPDVCVYPQSPTSGQVTSNGGSCSDEQGRLRIRYLRGDTGYALYVHVPGGSPYGDQWLGNGGGTGDRREAHVVRTEPGAEVTAPDVRLDPAGVISGVLTDRETGEPVRGQVTISPFHPGYGMDFGVYTDSTGRYEYRNLGPYQWPLFVTARGYASQWSGDTADVRYAEKIKVKAGATTPYDVALSTGTTITGTVAGVEQCWVLARNVGTGDIVGSGFLYPEGYELHVLGGQQVQLDCGDRRSEVIPVSGTGSLTVDF